VISDRNNRATLRRHGAIDQATRGGYRVDYYFVDTQGQSALKSDASTSTFDGRIQPPGAIITPPPQRRSDCRQSIILVTIMCSPSHRSCRQDLLLQASRELVVGTLTSSLAGYGKMEISVSSEVHQRSAWRLATLSPMCSCAVLHPAITLPTTLPMDAVHFGMEA